MPFEEWISACEVAISKALGFDKAMARRMIDGVGIDIFRDKFDRGMTPEQCIDDELMLWNE